MQVLRRDPAASVGHRDRDEPTHDGLVPAHRGYPIDGLHIDRELTLSVHGIACVDRHVDEGGVELACIGIDEALFLGKMRDDLDA